MSNYVKILCLLLSFSLTFTVNTASSNTQNSEQIIRPAIFVGQDHTMAINDRGEVLVWGLHYRFPTRLAGITGVVDIALAEYSDRPNYFLRNDGIVFEMSSNGSISQLQEVNNVVAIESGYDSLTVLKSDGTVWEKQNFSSPSVFLQKTELTDVVAINGDDIYGTALRSDGTVWADDSRIGGFSGGYVQVMPGLNSLTAATPFNEVTFLGLDATGHVWGFGDLEWDDDGIAGAHRVPINDVSAIAIGPMSYFALKTDGTVWVWSVIMESDMIWTPDFRNIIPERIDFPVAIASIAVDPDYDRAYAVGVDGSIWAWGQNGRNLLGDGGNYDRNAPVAVVGENGEGFLSLRRGSTQPVLTSLSINGPGTLAAGTSTRYHATAIYSDGRTATVTPDWSMQDPKISVDREGRVATDFSPLDRSVRLGASYMVGETRVVAEKEIQVTAKLPLQVTPQLVTSGYHTLALMPDGTVRSWGDNSYSALGDGTQTTSSVPVRVDSLTDVIFVAADPWRSYAVKQDGTVWQWGRGGDGSRSVIGIYGGAARPKLLIPEQIVGLENVAFVADIDFFYDALGGGYAVRNDGSLWEWDRYSQPHLVEQHLPSEIVSIVDNLVLTANGRVWYTSDFWSSNPVPVPGLENVVEIWSYSGAYLARDEAGFVWAWGGTDLPVKVDGLSDIVSITAIDVFTHTDAYAVNSNGAVYNWHYSFPDWGGAAFISYPEQLPVLSDVASVDAGGEQVLALRNDGTLFSWGANYYGQLGIGTFTREESTSLVVDGDLTGFFDMYPEVPNNIPTDIVPPFLLAASTAGGTENLTLDVELNLNNLFAVMQQRNLRSGAVYNVYVAAMLSAGVAGLVQPALFTLNSRNAWELFQGGPLPEFINGVEASSQDHRLLLHLFSSVDLTQFVGATIFIGYGSTDVEMIESGRYRAVYTVTNASNND